MFKNISAFLWIVGVFIATYLLFFKNLKKETTTIQQQKPIIFTINKKSPPKLKASKPKNSKLNVDKIKSEGFNNLFLYKKQFIQSKNRKDKINEGNANLLKRINYLQNKKDEEQRLKLEEENGELEFLKELNEHLKFVSENEK